MAESMSQKIENCISILSSHESKIKKTLGHQLITELCQAMKREKMVSKSGDFNTTMSRFKSRLKSDQGKNADRSSSVRLIFQFLDVLRSISTHKKILKLTDDIENDLKREIPPPAESSTSLKASPSSDETLPASKYVPSFPSPNLKPTSYSDKLQNTSSKPQLDCRFFMKPNGETTDPCTSTYSSDMPDHHSGYLSTDNDQGLTMGRLSGQNTNHHSLPETRLMNPGSTIPVEESGQQYSSLQMGGSNKRHSLQVETIGQQNPTQPLESRKYDSQPQLQRLTSTASGSLEYLSSSQHQMRSYNTSKSLQDDYQLDDDSSSNSSDVGHKRSKRKRHKSKSFKDLKGELKDTKAKFDEFRTQHNQQEKALRTGYKSEINSLKMEAKQTANQHKETEQNLRKRHNSEVQSLKTKLKHAQSVSRKQSQASLIDEKSNQLELRMKEIQEREIKLNAAENKFHLREIEHRQVVYQDRNDLRESIRIFETKKLRFYIISFAFVFNLLELFTFLIFLAYFKLK